MLQSPLCIGQNRRYGEYPHRRVSPETIMHTDPFRNNRCRTNPYHKLQLFGQFRRSEARLLQGRHRQGAVAF